MQGLSVVDEAGGVYAATGTVVDPPTQHRPHDDLLTTLTGFAISTHYKGL